MDTITLIGVVGAGSVLLAFLMNQIDRWKNDAFVYDGVNAVGSGLLIWYAYLIESWPFLVLNGVWFASAFYDLLTHKNNRS